MRRSRSTDSSRCSKALAGIGLSGRTPGKWLFGIRIAGPDGGPIGVWRALRREVSVFAYGLGLGLPLVSIVTLILAYRRLKSRGATRWDAGQGILVLHRPEGARQNRLNMVGLFLLGLLLFGLIALGGAAQ